LTGKLISSLEAKNLGLINDVIAADQIKQKVEEFAFSLCKQTSAQSLTLTKELISNVQELSLQDGLKYAAELNAKCRAESDCKKGIAAFLSKEKLTW
jgi:methylglutaconyl-CoA hydratase